MIKKKGNAHTKSRNKTTRDRREKSALCIRTLGFRGLGNWDTGATKPAKLLIVLKMEVLGGISFHAYCIRFWVFLQIWEEIISIWIKPSYFVIDFELSVVFNGQRGHLQRSWQRDPSKIMEWDELFVCLFVWLTEYKKLMFKLGQHYLTKVSFYFTCNLTLQTVFFLSAAIPFEKWVQCA